MRYYFLSFLFVLTLGLLVQLPPCAADESSVPQVEETQQQHDQRMAWWREARFGLFIHWGVYAVPAGTYQGEQIDLVFVSPSGKPLASGSRAMKGRRLSISPVAGSKS